ncbi:MAG: tRNA glutamyl-Q(34) synthetase GluQRS [Pseudomonadales bacterium]|nr:tRNA glutamyl-Q(34) synthetase GluQRS [Pseudomonadales bacterium]
MNAYIGRFAPSPTGPLHFGSLVAALASYLDARFHQGIWHLRIEDLDPPREIDSAPEEIIRQLQHFGFKWDGDILFQSTRISAYQEALSKLEDENRCYACICSRKSFKKVYPGTCRQQLLDSTPYAIRLQIPNKEITFEDSILGNQSWNLERDIGDFIIKRKDGLFAYQLAVVVDDEFQSVNTIIRGSDLLDSSPKQDILREYLNFQKIRYAHFPVVMGDDGQKLSKQAHAPAVLREDRAQIFNLALKALGQTSLNPESESIMMKQAVDNWSIDSVPKIMDQALNKL